MTLLSPAFLWAVPAAAIPLLIYLLFRRRRRNVTWGAIYILRQVMESRSRQMLWLQYLIIALRTLAVAAAVLLFARPHAPWRPPANAAFPPAPPSVHRVVLLDTSATMQAKHETGTRMDAALSLCRSLLLAGRFPGQLDLLPLSHSDVRFTVTRFPPRPERIEQILAGCAGETGPAAPDRALRAAAEIFRASPFARKELYLLGGFGRHDFADSAALAPRFRDLRRQGVSVFARRYHQADSRNFGVFDLSPDGDVLLALQPARFRATLGYYGDADTAETQVTVTDSRDRLLHQETLSLANGEKTVAFPLALPPGETTLTVRLPHDDLAGDNLIRRTFSVRPRVVVVVVQDIVAKTGFDNPRTWLNLALPAAVHAAGERDTSYRDVASAAQAYAAATRAEADQAELGAQPEQPFTIEIEGKIPEQLGADSLSRADLVILVDVDAMPAEAVETVHRHVLRGGTVLLAPGPDARPEPFNLAFAALTPLLLEPPQVETIDPERYEQCYAETGEDPFWRDLESGQGANLGSPRFYNRYGTKPDSLAPEARVILSLTDNAPLLAERRVGRGHVLLWTAGLGGDWHSLAVHAGFPVMLIRLANQAMDRREFPRNLAPGAPIIAPVEAARAKVLRPDGSADTIPATHAGGRAFIRYDRTDLPGDYDVRTDLAGDMPGLPYHVAAGACDSDVRSLDPARQAALEDAFDLRLCDRDADLIEQVRARYHGRPLSPGLAAALALGLLAEMWLSRRFFT
jgi:hypothetical protein